MRRAILPGFALVVALSGFARAEPPASPKVDPERLALARKLVELSQGDRAAVLAAMKGPMAAMVDQSMRQQGVTAPDKARIMTDEVLMPTLSAHYDELLDIQALAFAAAIPAEDLKAVVDFYATPAGRRFAKAQPQLAQAILVGIRQWTASLMPELQSKIMAAAKAHGWVPGTPGDRPKPN